ncbi:MAG: hypothetical protein AVDCRST_MAG95-925 [uncultured Adhaeribacter sp.]|uniref:3-keto-alpha-glucoside-1,2-lyase/3-keto-2-hydroxy-glucal hydratase domain-containing protein n=1 Tax=uncultured Adhaeribacter sp. TaxID=448109 RepID=A0A6J4HP60_9BACT|nr:MAG: hypothetical protein AVDCRST_MAG95-925 [uncultured Adhaeribacter sp.]
MGFKLLACSILLSVVAWTKPPQIPAGFRSIFNGKNLQGWHISRTTHQGTTPSCRVENNAIVLTQQPFGQGGVLLTDKKYRNFDLYLEAKIDSFTNGGIFIRSSESGMAYQIELDEAAGSTGSLLGERMPVSQTTAAKDKAKVWRANDWNAFRIRMVGAIPRITLWINGLQMWDVKQPQNDFIAGATAGMIGFQSHWTALYSPTVVSWNILDSWAPGAAHRFRNIAIKELPPDLKE